MNEKIEGKSLAKILEKYNAQSPFSVPPNLGNMMFLAKLAPVEALSRLFGSISLLCHQTKEEEMYTSRS